MRSKSSDKFTRYQLQRLKCRELIFTEPSILAQPTLDETATVDVIIEKRYSETSIWIDHLSKLKLKVYSVEEEVNRSVYQSCLKYTILAKLAPQWNVVSTYLVQGRDFLSSTSKLNAMHLELMVSDGKIQITLIPFRVHLGKMKLEYVVSKQVELQFYSQFPVTRTSITPERMANQWCHILPTMKKGQIASVTKSIPQTSDLKTYKDLKKHWKNQYGYRLPDEEPPHYYNIFFKMIGNKLFTYPECCIRHTDAITLPTQQPKVVVEEFVKILNDKVTNICSLPFKIDADGTFRPPACLQTIRQAEAANDKQNQIGGFGAELERSLSSQPGLKCKGRGTGKIFSSLETKKLGSNPKSQSAFMRQWLGVKPPTEQRYHNALKSADSSVRAITDRKSLRIEYSSPNCLRPFFSETVSKLKGDKLKRMSSSPEQTVPFPGKFSATSQSQVLKSATNPPLQIVPPSSSHFDTDVNINDGDMYEPEASRRSSKRIRTEVS
ncbi:C18orf63 (predicted) [Pycnogonum litorale]